MQFSAKSVLFSLSLSLILFGCGKDTELIENDVDKSKDPAESTYVKLNDGFSAITTEDGQVLYEAVAITPEMNFDKKLSLKSFTETLYPYLLSLPNVSPSGAPKPLYASDNIELAHEYALTQVYFNDPAKSKLVTDLRIYRKNCDQKCSVSAELMQKHILEWKQAISQLISETPRTVPANVQYGTQEIETAINEDRSLLPVEDRDYVVYTSLHKLHNNGASADELNIARAALSKALNSVARWAPKIVNPVDVTGKGLLYRFDIRHYWGWNKGVTELLFGGSDDDVAFGQNKFDYLGRSISGVLSKSHAFTDTVVKDPKLAKLIWQRVLHGEVEGAKSNGNVVPKLDGFYSRALSENKAGKYIKTEDLIWVDATQLVYTLTRPDVYAAIMLLPMHAEELEAELGVDNSKGLNSYDYFVTLDAPTVDAQFALKGKRGNGGFYWKTFEVFTGNLSKSGRSILDIYKENGEDIRFPFWANPVPIFIDPSKVQEDNTHWSFVASLAQAANFEGFTPIGTPECEGQPGAVNGFEYCKHFTGTGGMQQSESTIIWDLPNGLNGYMRAGGSNQRRIDAFLNVIRDPRLMPDADDNIATHTGFSYTNGTSSAATDPRMNASSSLISLYPDGLNRTTNDLRDWLDSDPKRLPKGPFGVDAWIDDKDTVAEVKALYPTTAESSSFFESSRKTFLTAMGKIKFGMVIGDNKNVYVEPVIWAVEYLLEHPAAVTKPDPVTPDPIDPIIDPVTPTDDLITEPKQPPVPNPTLTGSALVNAEYGFSALSNGAGGINYEAVAITPEMNFDKAASLKAFAETLYPYLRSLPNASPSGAPAPLHSSDNMALAHEYALTEVNFRDPKNSKLVTDLKVYRKNCVSVCAHDASSMLEAIEAWKSKIADMISLTPRVIPADQKVTIADIEAWIAKDKLKLPKDQLAYFVYTSLSELHNSGATADELNIVRVGLSKALNSVARWAPAIVNPVDVNGKGMLYRFDIRHYWGWNKGITQLIFGGSDDDLAFAQKKYTYLGVATNNEQTKKYPYTKTVSQDPSLASLIWQRILHGNVEGAKTSGNLNANIKGFYGKTSTNAAGTYIKAEDFEWVEASQLIYTLTRPDVYVSAMMIPMYADQLEEELGVDKNKGMDSYNYFVTFDALTVDAQLALKGKRENGGFYWKTFEVFTGALSGGDRNIYEVYKEGGDDIRFPFWANPIPNFVRPDTVEDDPNLIHSFIATLAQTASFPGFAPRDSAGCDDQPGAVSGFGFCKHYTGLGGSQQSFSTIIWDLPNGLNGYMLAGGFNQRRLDSFNNVMRDPALLPNADDNIVYQTGYAFDSGLGSASGEPRLNASSSLINLYPDGLNRTPNDLRDWLDSDQDRLPKGPYGVDGWISDEATVARVKELYPTTAESQSDIEDRRKTFLHSMALIQKTMILGDDKNIYIEPILWSVQKAQKIHGYPQTSGN